MTTTFARLITTHFVVECVPMVSQHDPNRIGAVMSGTLKTNSLDSIDVVFRVKGYRDNLVRCGFYQIDEARQEWIDAHVKQACGENASRESLPSDTAVVAEKKPSKKLRYALVACAGIMGAGLLFGDPGETVSVADSFVGGQNFIVQTPEPGRLVKLMVEVGDRVEAGDVMAKLVKGNDRVRIETIDAKLNTTEKEIEVFERQRLEAAQAVSRHKQIVGRKLQLAEQDKSRLAEKVESAQAYLKRIAPLIKSENIGRLEVAELKAAVETAKADLASQEDKIKDLKIAVKAADRDAVFTEHGILTPTKDVEAKIEVAQAKLAELVQTRDAIEQVIQTVDIVAPDAGVVQAVHLAKGKEHRTSDQAIELQLGSRSLLTGFVVPERASSIKPGQSVEVVVPSRNLTLAGKVMTVGQIGRLNIKPMDRRLPTDVAVQVQLEETEHKLTPTEKIDVSVTTKTSNASALSEWFSGLFSGDGEAS